jgi:hypothetical protein
MVLFVAVTEVVGFALFLILPFYKFVLLFSINVGVVNFTLLKLFASWCCSYVVSIHRWDLMLFVLVTKVVNFALFLLMPFCKLIIFFMIVVGAMSLTLFCKLVLLMHCSCSSLKPGVVRTYCRSYDLQIILTSTFLQVGCVGHGHCWNHVMLLRFFASKSSSLLFMFVVETHFSSFQ